jgi:hypothetical protein
MVVKTEAIRAARGRSRAGLRISPPIMPATSNPVMPYAMDARKFTVFQLKSGSK